MQQTESFDQIYEDIKQALQYWGIPDRYLESVGRTEATVTLPLHSLATQNIMPLADLESVNGWMVLQSTLSPIAKTVEILLGRCLVSHVYITSKKSELPRLYSRLLHGLSLANGKRQ